MFDDRAYPVILHRAKTSSPFIRELDYPMIETPDEWVILGSPMVII
jgi:hypothetical protein